MDISWLYVIVCYGIGIDRFSVYLPVPALSYLRRDCAAAAAAADSESKYDDVAIDDRIEFAFLLITNCLADKSRGWSHPISSYKLANIKSGLRSYIID